MGRLSGGATVAHVVAVDFPTVVTIGVVAHNSVGMKVVVYVSGIGLP